MKKSKVILAIALAVILLVTCLSAPTFSWFTRPYPPVPAQSGGADAAAGNVLGLTSKNVYTAYNGKNVTMTTTACTTGAEAHYAEATSASGLGASSDVSVTDRQYFCTTITNSSGTEQNISLYANQIHATSNQFALGVNSPMRTYRNFYYRNIDPTYTWQDNSNTMRVYFKRPQSYDDHTWDFWLTGNYWMKWWDSNNNEDYAQFTVVPNTNNTEYYTDIPTSATGAYVYIGGSNQSGDNRTENIDFTTTYQSQSTPQMYTAYNEKVSYSNVKIGDHSEVSYSPYFVKYYKTITLVPGATFNAKLYYPDCSGSMEFESANEKIFTVDENGMITAGSTTGNAQLTTKAIGNKGDQYWVYTTVTVANPTNGYTYSDVPIVKNLRIPVDSSSTQNEHENIIKVYWYIKKNGSSLSFKIDRIYLGP